MTLTNRAGHKYGRLMVLHRVPRHAHDFEVYWNCQCECGNLVVVTGRNLRSGNSQSCGCLSRERARARLRTHGLAHSVEHETWMRIKARCYNRRNKAFANYGGRGIIVCERWLKSFPTFLADMGPRPSNRTSIDRIDNDGPYGPENCRWATTFEQAGNKRSCHRLTYQGETHPLAIWARRKQLSRGLVEARLQRGWTVDRALDTPSNASRHKYLNLRGRTQSIEEWSKQTGIARGTIHARLRVGWSVERALTTPVK